MVAARDLNLNRSTALTEYINQRVAEGWRFDFFPEWLECEERAFRQRYSTGEFIEAGMERLFTADGNYYQALQGQLAATQAPALLTGGTYVENSAYWARSLATYSLLGDWTTGTVYAVGDKVRNPDNGLNYQCIAAHTAGASFDGTQFGVLTAFERTIEYLQLNETRIETVKRVCRRNPRVYRANPAELPFQPNNTGIAVAARTGEPPATVWVEFRRPPPEFTVTRWVSGTAYDVGDLVYYRGDCYRSLVGNNTSVGLGLPEWELQPMPMCLANWVKRAVVGGGKSDQNQTDRATQMMSEAHEELQDVYDREIEAQGQAPSATVVTYGA